MSERTETTGGDDGESVTEIVGRFETRAAFTEAVERLLAVGFERTDLSVLDTHETIETGEADRQAWQDRLAGLVGEVNYIGPITAAGLIAIATGPVGAAVSGIIAAGLTGWALKDVLETAQATPHSETFARALEHGALLLWVYAETPDRQETARRILEAAGARDVHRHARPPQAAQS